MYRRFIKRVFDVIMSFILLLVVFPLLLIVIVVLFIINKNSGVFFLQKRPGKNSKIFNVIKFKTMIDKYDSNHILLPDQDRLTKFGRLLRAASIDELPQLINVLKGDMSIIGPRPLLVAYLPLYNEFQSKRHNVRPGITGWAQVNGRNAMLFSERFSYDVYYVDNLSFTLDFKILILTVKKVFNSDGVISGQDVKEVDDLEFYKNI